MSKNNEIQPTVLDFKHGKYAVASLTMEEEDLSHLLDTGTRLASQYDIPRPLVVVTPLRDLNPIAPPVKAVRAAAGTIFCRSARKRAEEKFFRTDRTGSS